MPTLPPGVELPNEFSSAEPITLSSESLATLALNPSNSTADASSALPDSLLEGIPTTPTAPTSVAISAEAYPPKAIQLDEDKANEEDDGYNYEGIDWDRLSDL